VLCFSGGILCYYVGGFALGVICEYVLAFVVWCGCVVLFGVFVLVVGFSD